MMTPLPVPRPGESAINFLRRRIAHIRAEREAERVAELRESGCAEAEVDAAITELRATHEMLEAAAMAEIEASGHADAPIVPATATTVH